MKDPFTNLQRRMIEYEVVGKDAVICILMRNDTLVDILANSHTVVWGSLTAMQLGVTQCVVLWQYVEICRRI